MDAMTKQFNQQNAGILKQMTDTMTKERQIHAWTKEIEDKTRADIGMKFVEGKVLDKSPKVEGALGCVKHFACCEAVSGKMDWPSAVKIIDHNNLPGDVSTLVFAMKKHEIEITGPAMIQWLLEEDVGLAYKMATLVFAMKKHEIEITGADISLGVKAVSEKTDLSSAVKIINHNNLPGDASILVQTVAAGDGASS